ncbi:hypothetical protein M2272_005907 [Mycobacterium frederiksbergense]|uniref:Uncharacterized protein n=1 Tax=Mycolicibacterium frederiksbergense TaxID=117567 RepID=A0ABT6L8I1_9MYCO|nr:hypothetical protein [Mycolicibacterium frederiksbergense]MDH6199239.1 hypothetical protein [Mycolicibacterium frederiksbergense]
MILAFVNAAACGFNVWIYANSGNTVNLAFAVFSGILALGIFLNEAGR